MVIKKRKRAFYGGSFDPVHCGHLRIAEALLDRFALDEFTFIPAFHAPHKPHRKPTSGYHRYAMLCLATRDASELHVSLMELELPEKPYSVETLARLNESFPDDEIYFVMGADSWQDITTWREWEKVLLMTNHIVVTRPGHVITTDHVTPEIRSRIADLRGGRTAADYLGGPLAIYLTDAVNMDISATEVRQSIREGLPNWQQDLDDEVAKYIEKYQIYT